MPHQCIDKGSSVIAVCRMHDHSGFLVYNNDIIVLVYDVEWNVFRYQFYLPRGIWKDYLDQVAGFHPVVWLYRLIVNENVTRVGGIPYPCSGSVFQSGKQEFVHA